jgi:hypothetical protein
MAAVRRDVEALAAMDRGSAGPGERAAAQWGAGRLRHLGLAEVRVDPFRYQPTWAARQAPHFACGLLAAALDGLAGRAIALATLASLHLEVSGRAQPLARAAPAGEGANAVGTIPARGERRRTLVLVAHLDTARTGLLWRLLDRAPDPGPGGPPSFAALPLAALAALAATSRRGPRALAGGVLASSLAMALDVARSATVPGASDNATGVAATLAIAERLAADPPDGLETIILLAGCEESGMGGMAAWLRAVRQDLDPATTLVLGLDTLGAGEPVTVTADGPPFAAGYRVEDLAWADRGADRAGLPAPRRSRLGGWTDPILARYGGLPAVSLVSLRGGRFTNYHLPTDTPERVDWDSVDRCARLATGVAAAWAAG